MEFPVDIVFSGFKEICQHLIFIRCANHLSDRRADFLCNPCRQNIAKVAGRNNHIE